MQKLQNIKTAIFDVQLPFYALKRLNDSLSLTNLFYACFNGLKLVCKSYVALEFIVESGFEYWKRIIKCHMIWRRVSKSWSKWLKCFTVCGANDLKYWMTETNFDRRKSKTRVFWLLFCSQKSDRKYFTFIFVLTQNEPKKSRPRFSTFNSHFTH